MPSWTLPLCPSANHMYRNDGRGGKIKTDALLLWEDLAALELHGWEPPKRTPLRVTIALHIPRAKLWTLDHCNYEKPVTDRVIGARRDQWVQDTHITKQATTGEPCVVVSVEEIDA